MAAAERAWEKREEEALKVGTTIEAFDRLGGDAYNGIEAPHPRCPECFGEGVVVVFVKDTRSLSDRARLLYAGAKVTKGGIEIKMRDRNEALTNVARHLGMFAGKGAFHQGTDEEVQQIQIIEIYRPPDADDGQNEDDSRKSA